jgi:hypothetical protein
VLGNGSALALSDLPVGTNVVTLTATNSAGLSASTSVTVTVGDDLALPGPTLAAGPSLVAWHVAAGEVQAQTAALEIFNSGGGELSWSATSDAPWLTLSAASGNGPATITLSADPQGMINGATRSATVRVTTTSGGGTQLVEVPVVLAAGRVWELGGEPPIVRLPIVWR